MSAWELARELEGDAELGGAARPARLVLDAEGLRARFGDGEERFLPWGRARLGRDAAGRLVVSDRRQRLAISSTDPEFARAVEGAGGNLLADRLADLEEERRRLRVPLGGLLALLVLVLLVAGVWRACSGLASGVESLVDRVPFEVDERLGELALASAPMLGAELDDPVVLAALRAIVERLAPHSGRPDADFRIRVLRAREANAFALPGGHLTATSALVARARAPEELAGVLAHEMAHVSRRHGLRRLVHQLGLAAGAELLLGDLEGLAGMAEELYRIGRANGYSREQEAEADAEAVRILGAAGIDPAAALPFLERVLAEESADAPAFEWMRTHPDPRARLAALRSHVAAAGPPAQERPLEVDWAAVLERLPR